jgi:hypothetical protein
VPQVRGGHCGFARRWPPLKASFVTPFQKSDAGKPRWTLVPWDAMSEVVAVLEHGAQKYGVDNWVNVDEPRRYVDAAFRHLIAYDLDEDIDSESGRPHLAHAVCSLLFLISIDGAKR